MRPSSLGSKSLGEPPVATLSVRFGAVQIHMQGKGAKAYGLEKAAEEDALAMLRAGRAMRGLSITLCDEAFVRENYPLWHGSEAAEIISRVDSIQFFNTGDERLLGEVVICLEVAEQQAAVRGHGVRDEMRLLLVHGLSHLAGYDHAESRQEAAAQVRLETQLMEHLGWKGGSFTLWDAQGKKGNEMPLELKSARAQPEQEWYRQWQHDLGVWWAATPLKEKLGSCFGALGLHITAQLEWALRLHLDKLWGLERGRASFPPPPAPTTEAGCEWIAESASELDLPDFPEFPSQFELPPLVPVPRLLLPVEQWTHSLSEGEGTLGVQPQRARADDGLHARKQWSPFVSGAGAGAGAASMLLAVLLFVGRRGRVGSANGRTRLPVGSGALPTVQ